MNTLPKKKRAVRARTTHFYEVPTYILRPFNRAHYYAQITRVNATHAAALPLRGL